MNAIKRVWAALTDEVIAQAELRAAELRTGVSLIEAISADEKLGQLRLVTNTEAGAQDLLEVAVELGKCGVTSDLIGALVNAYWTTVSRGITDRDLREFGLILMRHDAGVTS